MSAGPPRTAVTSSLNFAGPTFTDSGAFPPDTMGAVGPSQFVVAINGRFRSYNKATGAADGALDVSPDTFFSSVMTPPVATNFTSDPHIRYDRLSQRWMIVMIDVPGAAATLENRVLVAVSDTPVITGSTVWSFFFFNEDAGGPDDLFADYPTLGVDANALYIGANMFTLGGAFSKTNMYVVRKSSILGAGPLVVTRFNGAAGAGAGPFTPQGVDNFAPGATTGFFIGVDNSVFSRLDVRTVTDPGGTPTLSGDLAVTVPATTFPAPVDHLGNTGGANGRLDALDDRLFAAQLRGGHIWTAHNIRVNASGVASSSGGRNGSRWYEVDVSGAPALVQSGTVFDAAASTPNSYWIPTVAVSGQNMMAIGGSIAGANHHADAWFSGRLAGDPAGQTDTPTEYTATAAAYNPPGDPGGGSGRRWGDFSMTSVDPDDDMTLWTIQEYTSSTNVWGTRVARLRAPGPATVTSATPSHIPGGEASTAVTVTGVSAGGTGFFDPGAGFAKRLAAAVTCGITVTSVTFVNATTVQLDLNTTGSTGGACDVTITNPDGQASTGTGILDADAAPLVTADAGWSAPAPVKGDFNGDGFSDLAIGAPGEGIGAAGGAGAVHVIYGTAGGLASTGSQQWTQDSAGIADSAEAGDGFGSALAVGDLNGDGRADLAIGVPGEGNSAVEDSGAVHVLYGTAAGLASTGSQLWTQNSSGIADTAEAGDGFGSSLAVGDVGAGATGDLAIGAPGEGIGAAGGAGAVHVIYGTAGGLTSTGSQQWTQNSAGIADTTEAGDHFGSALAIGDVGSGATGDLAIGVPGEGNSAVDDSGAVHVLYGTAAGLASTGSQLWTQNSSGIADTAEAGDGFGSSLAVGDVGAGATGDLAIGAPGEGIGAAGGAGAVHVIYGTAGGLTSTGSQQWTQNSAGIADTTEAGDHFGSALAIGDVGSGATGDLAIGVPGEGNSAVDDSGAVHVLYGNGGGLAAAEQPALDAELERDRRHGRGRRPLRLGIGDRRPR